MAQSSACRTFLQNLLFGSKDKFTSAVFIKDNNTLAVSRTPTSAFFVNPLIASTLSSMAKYSKKDFKWIFKTVLDFRPPLAPTPALVVAPH